MTARDIGDARGRGGGVRHVETCTAGRETLAAQRGAPCVDRSLIPPVDDDVRARRRERTGEHRAKAARGSGHECDAAREVEELGCVRRDRHRVP